MKRGIPVCFDSGRQYALWREAALRRPPGSSTYCADCTPEYQQRMVGQGRCAHPRTTFHLDREGYVEGRRPIKDRVRRKEGT